MPVRSAFNDRIWSPVDLVRVDPPVCHMSAFVTGGLDQCYKRVKSNTDLTVHDYDAFTDDEGHFCLKGDCFMALRYRVLNVIDSKGQSAVLVKAQDTFRANHVVAIKVLHRNFFSLGGQESHMLWKLAKGDPQNLSNTLRLLNTFTFDDHFCMVFECLLPPPLTVLFADLPREHVIPSIQKVALQLLTVLGFLQQQNVIHADLKPENMLLKSANDFRSIKLVDFGNAIHCIHKEVSMYYNDFELQTPLYRAPEVIFGQPFGLEIDMWSLGCVLAELYLGRPLFLGSSRQGVIANITKLMGKFPLHIFRKGKYFEQLKRHTDEAEQPDATGLIVDLLHTRDFIFANFIAGLLRYNPDERLNPVQAARHPFLARELPLCYLLPASQNEIHSYPGVIISNKFYKHRPHVSQQIQKMHLSSLDLLRLGSVESKRLGNKLDRAMPNNIAKVCPVQRDSAAQKCTIEAETEDPETLVAVNDLSVSATASTDFRTDGCDLQGDKKYISGMSSRNKQVNSLGRIKKKHCLHHLTKKVLANNGHDRLNNPVQTKEELTVGSKRSTEQIKRVHRNNVDNSHGHHFPEREITVVTKTSTEQIKRSCHQNKVDNSPGQHFPEEELIVFAKASTKQINEADNSPKQHFSKGEITVGTKVSTQQMKITCHRNKVDNSPSQHFPEGEVTVVTTTDQIKKTRPQSKVDNSPSQHFPEGEVTVVTTSDQIKKTRPQSKVDNSPSQHFPEGEVTVVTTSDQIKKTRPQRKVDNSPSQHFPEGEVTVVTTTDQIKKTRPQSKVDNSHSRHFPEGEVTVVTTTDQIKKTRPQRKVDNSSRQHFPEGEVTIVTTTDQIKKTRPQSKVDNSPSQHFPEGEVTVVTTTDQIKKTCPQRKVDNSSRQLFPVRPGNIQHNSNYDEFNSASENLIENKFHGVEASDDSYTLSFKNKLGGDGDRCKVGPRTKTVVNPRKRSLPHLPECKIRRQKIYKNDAKINIISSPIKTGESLNCAVNSSNYLGRFRHQSRNDSCHDETADTCFDSGHEIATQRRSNCLESACNEQRQCRTKMEGSTSDNVNDIDSELEISKRSIYSAVQFSPYSSHGMPETVKRSDQSKSTHGKKLSLEALMKTIQQEQVLVEIDMCRRTENEIAENYSYCDYRKGKKHLKIKCKNDAAINTKSEKVSSRILMDTTFVIKSDLDQQNQEYGNIDTRMYISGLRDQQNNEFSKKNDKIKQIYPSPKIAKKVPKETEVIADTGLSSACHSNEHREEKPGKSTEHKNRSDAMKYMHSSVAENVQVSSPKASPLNNVTLGVEHVQDNCQFSDMAPVCMVVSRKNFACRGVSVRPCCRLKHCRDTSLNICHIAKRISKQDRTEMQSTHRKDKFNGEKLLNVKNIENKDIVNLKSTSRNSRDIAKRIKQKTKHHSRKKLCFNKIVTVSECNINLKKSMIDCANESSTATQRKIEENDPYKFIVTPTKNTKSSTNLHSDLVNSSQANLHSHIAKKAVGKVKIDCGKANRRKKSKMKDSRMGCSAELNVDTSQYQNSHSFKLETENVGAPVYSSLFSNIEQDREQIHLNASQQDGCIAPDGKLNVLIELTKMSNPIGKEMNDDTDISSQSSMHSGPSSPQYSFSHHLQQGDLSAVGLKNQHEEYPSDMDDDEVILLPID